jgi:hypothetical protein
MLTARVAGKAEREAVPGSWQARRKVLLVLVAFVPVLLILYSFAAAVVASPGQFARSGALLVLTAFLITGIGGYVIWDSLTSLARVGAPTKRLRHVLNPAERHAS